jgi:hypothetical protein
LRIENEGKGVKEERKRKGEENREIIKVGENETEKRKEGR